MSTAQNQNFRDVLLKALSQPNPNEWGSIYLPFERFELLLNSAISAIPDAQMMVVGHSKHGKPIYEIVLGNGPKKLLMWSQMHGNEASGTRAILNFLRAVATNTPLFTNVFNLITIVIIPMVNPDGATAYTRRNLEGIDLNRDARACFSNETRVLQDRLVHHQPDLALNLHDQRSLFGIKGANAPAIMSFLNPSFNTTKELTDSRRFAMRVIASIYNSIAAEYPNAVGRYTDDYYPTAMGEWVQEKGVPCILVEAGMKSGDWMKQVPVQLHAHVFTESFAALMFETELLPEVLDYFQIPEMHQSYVDCLCDKTQFHDLTTNVNIALTRRYSVEKGILKQEWVLQDFGDLRHLPAHEKKAGIKLRVQIDDINNLIGKDISDLIDGLYD